MRLSSLAYGLPLVLAMVTAASAAPDGAPAGRYLKLQPKALLAPAPIGPPESFAPGGAMTIVTPPPAAPEMRPALTPDTQVETRNADVVGRDTPRAAAGDEESVSPAQTARPARRAARKPVQRKPATVARQRSNPLDAQARARKPAAAAKSSVRTWPCTSGAICQWQR